MRYWIGSPLRLWEFGCMCWKRLMGRRIREKMGGVYSRLRTSLCLWELIQLTLPILQWSRFVLGQTIWGVVQGYWWNAEIWTLERGRFSFRLGVCRHRQTRGPYTELLLIDIQQQSCSDDWSCKIHQGDVGPWWECPWPTEIQSLLCWLDGCWGGETAGDNAGTQLATGL